MNIDIEIKIEECIEIIKAKEVEKLDYAISTLKSIGSDAYKLLCLSLKYADEFECMYLTNAIIKIGNEMLPYLHEIFNNLEGVNKCYVIFALGELKDKKIIDILKSSFNDPNPEVRQAVLQVINKLNSLEEFKNEFDSILYKALNDNDIYVRGYAAGILGNMKTEIALDDLITMSEDSEQSVRAVSASSLGNFKNNKKAIETLKNMLNDQMTLVVSAACLALAKCGDESVIDDIAKLLNNKNDLIRLSAVKALGRLRSKKAIPYLKQCLDDKNETIKSLAEQVIQFLERNE